MLLYTSYSNQIYPSKINLFSVLKDLFSSVRFVDATSLCFINNCTRNHTFTFLQKPSNIKAILVYMKISAIGLL
jgi:hypothetical protein